ARHSTTAKAQKSGPAQIGENSRSGAGVAGKNGDRFRKPRAILGIIAGGTANQLVASGSMSTTGARVRGGQRMLTGSRRGRSDAPWDEWSSIIGRVEPCQIKGARDD